MFITGFGAKTLNRTQKRPKPNFFSKTNQVHTVSVQKIIQKNFFTGFSKIINKTATHQQNSKKPTNALITTKLLQNPSKN